MPHEIAKLLLEHASTFLEKTEAVKSAMYLGMPMNEIEEYLDWLDAMRGQRAVPSDGTDGKAPGAGEPTTPDRGPPSDTTEGT